MTTEAAPDEDICTACGLCCDGTLFARVELQPDEVEAARLAGFTVIFVKEQPNFHQPCVQLCGTLCGVYASRPQRCRAFECATLKALNAGQIGADEARRRIVQARAAVDKVRPEFLPGENFRAARIRFHKAAAQLEGFVASPMFKLHMGALELVLDKYFRSPENRLFKHTEDGAAVE